MQASRKRCRASIATTACASSSTVGLRTDLVLVWTFYESTRPCVVFKLHALE